MSHKKGLRGVRYHLGVCRDAVSKALCARMRSWVQILSSHIQARHGAVCLQHQCWGSGGREVTGAGQPV